MPMKYPPHPGRSILRDCMEPLGMSVAETAQKLGVSAELLRSVIDGQASISPSMAAGLDKLFGGGASTWYQLQAQYDEAQERNKNIEDPHGREAPEDLEPFLVYQQTATAPYEHGRVVYKTFDAEVIAFRIVPPDDPRLANNPNYERVEYRFVGEGPGAIQIRMIYQPSPSYPPRIVADVLFKAYLEWDATSEEYIGHIDAAEWNRESRKLAAGVETMNALHAGLHDKPTIPALDLDESAVLREAEELLGKGSVPKSASELPLPALPGV